MRYFKYVSNGTILAVGRGHCGQPIPEEDYIKIVSLVRNRPAREGYGYRLRDDLTWEEYELPNEPDIEPDPTIEDYEAVLREVANA